MRTILLILLFGCVFSQLTVSQSTAKCTCVQYLSQADCQSTSIPGGACTWGTSCTQPNCSNAAATATATAQAVCNALNGCSWSSSKTCITTVCNQLNSTSAGGSCSNEGCGQSTTASSDGSFPCIAATAQTITSCTSQSTTASCATLTYCMWANNACVDATCDKLSSANCNFVYKNSAAAAGSIVQLPCILNGTTCSNVIAAKLTTTNCQTKSAYTYTWSAKKSACVSCATGSGNVIIAFLLGFIMMFA